MPVAHVWIIGLICLLVGSLLNAPGIRKTALGQPVGWKRDVATFFANPLYDVSHALYLDRLQLGFQEVLGRGGDDDVDLSLPSPTLPGPGQPGSTSTTLPPKRAFSPATPMQLWVGGDSLSITPGESVVNFVTGNPVIGVTNPVDGHVSTGLARPEVFNWPSYLAGVTAGTHPNTMVLTLGSNDDQTLTGDGGGQPFGSPEWEAEYRRRVGGLMDQVTADGTTLFWVGIPPIRDAERYFDHYRLINEIARSEAAKRPRKVSFVDTAALLAGPDGGFVDYLPNPDGTVVQVRTTDGIHFTRAGADRIAGAIVGAFAATFDLTSWQRATTTTTSKATTTSTRTPPR